LWLIFARIIEQGSRLSAIRLGSIYDIASILKFSRGFDENDFYESLHWIAQKQDEIENYLFKLRDYSEQFYWYDVTSSYFEGTQNALAAYGHNRDKKKRKKQIVIGLLSINDGMPISVEAFAGNTQDTQTFQSQLEKLKSRFGCKNVILVGDRGMIRKKQKLLAKEYGYKFITALTLPEVNSLLNDGHLTLLDFKSELQSICLGETRYIYRRNPGRAKETQRQRQERLATAQKRVDQENEKLRLKPKTSALLAKNRTRKYLGRLCISEWVNVCINKRELQLEINQDKLNERAKYDGCYIWTTELGTDEATDREVYDRYKDLKYVEDDFRTFKTNFLEIRPIHVRTPASTKGHLFITMLAHMLVKELRVAWFDMNITVQEGLRQLSLICQNSIRCSDDININIIPEPSKEISLLLEALKIKLPKTIETVQVRVVTRHQTKKSS
jgi:transposase